jgi:hypothetical protein
VRFARVWARLAGVERGVVVERVEFDEDADAANLICPVAANGGCPLAATSPGWVAVQPERRRPRGSPSTGTAGTPVRCRLAARSGLGRRTLLVSHDRAVRGGQSVICRVGEDAPDRAFCARVSHRRWRPTCALIRGVRSARRCRRGCAALRSGMVLGLPGVVVTRRSASLAIARVPGAGGEARVRGVVGVARRRRGR